MCEACPEMINHNEPRQRPTVEDDVVKLRAALDYPKLGYGINYREALEALDRLAGLARRVGP